VIDIVIILLHNYVTSGPWKELANTNDFYDAPPSQPEMEDGTMPIDGVAYCDQEQYDKAMRAGKFIHEQSPMDLLYSTSKVREVEDPAPRPRTKAKLKAEGPPPTPHDLEWLYNQIDGTFCHASTCLNVVIYLFIYCYILKALYVAGSGCTPLQRNADGALSVVPLARNADGSISIIKD